MKGLSNLSLLKASHIKPWRDSSNQERLDPENGLLLHPALDHLFDSGLITFDDTGKIVISEKLSESDLEKLNVTHNMVLRKISDGTKRYLKFHRKNVFK
jgi:putative restriction endonuclease